MVVVIGRFNLIAPMGSVAATYESYCGRGLMAWHKSLACLKV